MSLGLAACDGSSLDLNTTSAAVAPTGSASTFVSNTIPANMAPGEKVNVQVVVQNTGTVDWTNTSEWGLRADNLDFSFLNDFMDVTTPIGSSSTHNIVLTAPATSATFSANFYSFISGQSGPVPGGPLTAAITVSGATTPQYACSFVSSTIPNPATAGSIQPVTVTVQNSGAQSWSSGDFCLYARENADTTNPSITRWGSNICSTTGSVIAPGATETFSLTLSVPSTPGTYRFMRQMSDNRGRENGGIGFFSDSAFCVDESITVTAGTPSLAASVVSDTVPTQAAPGDVVPVTITMRNDGATTWTTGSNITFESTNSPVAFWGPTSASLSGDVATGQTATFSLTVRVPSSPTGSQPFSFRMFQSGVGFFGDTFSTNIDISGMVTPQLDASVTANTLPTTMAPNSTQAVSVTVQNTGTETWASDGTFGLVSNTSPTNFWGLSTITLDSSVANGASTTFTFNVTSPNSLTSETFRYQMWKSGSGVFGEELVVNTTISGAVTPQYDASVVSQTIPTTMEVNTTQSFSITMQNTGTETWPANSTISLTSNNSPLTLWGSTTTFIVDTDTAPMANASFTFNVTAPNTPGTYTSNWRMLRSGAGYFGTAAETTGITVTTPAGCGDGTVVAPETCDDGGTTSGDGCSSSCIIEPLTRDLSSATPGRTFFGHQPSIKMHSIILKDLNGDGSDDFITYDFTSIPFGMGRPSRNQAGQVYVYYGGAGFFDQTSTSITASPSILVKGRETGDHLGGNSDGVRVGDVTGDGNNDLIIAAEFGDGDANASASAGEVYVLTGGATLYAGGTFDMVENPSVVGATYVGEAAGDQLQVIEVGDVTNDGVDDIILASTRNDVGGTDAGIVYVVTGGAGLATTSTTVLSNGVAGVAARIVGPAASARFGVSAAIGDFTGDGINDLAISAPEYSPNGRTRAGAVFVFNGPVSGTFNTGSSGYSTRFSGGTIHDLYGTDLAAGDVLDTSGVDLIVGVSQAFRDTAQVGEVNVWANPISSGEIDRSVTAPSLVVLGGTADYVGGSVDVGDVNGDGRGDILVGAGQADGAGDARTNAGEIDIIIGENTFSSLIGFQTSPRTFRIIGSASNDILGLYRNSVAIGDLNNDSRADWCVGSFLGDSNTATDSGRIDCFESPY